ncbi:MAG: S8 family serine peptidase, partial [Pseudomonadota bacterium]
EDGRVASFSNATTERGAPRYFVGCGVGVVSADHAGDGLVVDNGTSMACPHVAGVAALHFETLRLAGSTSPVLRQDVMTDLRRSARDWRNAAAGIDDPLDVGLGSPTAPA